MYNTMNGVNVADKLKLGPEVRELKFGPSFTGGRNQQQGSFHSVRYDFKPASVDTSKMATLDVGSNGQVTISMPNIDGNGTTVFKGARKPHAKECVLIIDNETGEVTLERLTHNIQVKRTREEGGSKKSSGAMSIQPAPPPANDMKKIQSSFKTEPKMTISNSGSSSSSSRDRERDREDSKKNISHASMPHPSQGLNSKRGTSNSPMPPHQQPRQSPNNRPSPAHATSPPMTFSPSAGMSQESQRQPKQTQQQSNLLSLTDFEDLLSMPPMNPPPSSKSIPDKASIKEPHTSSINPPPTSMKPPASGTPSKNAPTSALSESSSGEDSSSSSSSDDDDDDSSDMEDVPDKIPLPVLPDITASKPLPPVLGGSSGGRSMPQTLPPVAPSMPTNLLCDDLQLSESGSDSE